MTADIDEMIAASLDADPALMPVLDYLLQDVDTLGGDPGQIVGMLRPLAMTGKVRLVLDLGCGKGTIATALAADLGLHVTGIDAFAPFIEEARARAAAMGVADRCLFRAADMRRAVGRLPAFDAVLLIDCGGVFGDFASTSAALRTLTRPGGFMVVAETCRLGGSGGASPGGALAGAAPPAVVADHDTVASGLTAHGDHIVMEKHGHTLEAADESQRAGRMLERRAEELMSLYPGLHAPMRAYVDAYRRRGHGNDEETVVPTIWIVQKNVRE